MAIEPVESFLGIAQSDIRSATILSPDVAVRNVKANIQNALAYIDTTPQQREIADAAVNAATGFGQTVARHGLFASKAPEIEAAREAAIQALERLETALRDAPASAYGRSLGY